MIGLPAVPEGFDAILVFGGDGTVHRHLGALVKLGLPVLVVPAGSGNDFARALGLLRERDSLAAWRIFASGGKNVRFVDLGVITPIESDAGNLARAAQKAGGEPAHLNRLSQESDLPVALNGPGLSRVVRATKFIAALAAGVRGGHPERFAQPHVQACSDAKQRHEADPSRDALESAPDGRGRLSLHTHDARGKAVYFSCVAGVGLDGEISRRANALPRWLRAHGGYALSLPAALLRFRPFLLKLSVASEQSAGDFFPRSQQPVTAAVFANTPVYGGGMKIAPRAKMDDGQLDVCVIRDISKLKLLGVFPSVYFGRHLGIHEVEYFPAACARVETERPLDVYADGEYVCRTPVEFSVARGCLRVIVPG
jgi:diacylglycerol kinase family enzyme